MSRLNPALGDFQFKRSLSPNSLQVKQARVVRALEIEGSIILIKECVSLLRDLIWKPLITEFALFDIRKEVINDVTLNFNEDLVRTSISVTQYLKSEDGIKLFDGLLDDAQQKLVKQGAVAHVIEYEVEPLFENILKEDIFPYIETEVEYLLLEEELQKGLYFEAFESMLYEMNRYVGTREEKEALWDLIRDITEEQAKYVIEYERIMVEIYKAVKSEVTENMGKIEIMLYFVCDDIINDILPDEDKQKLKAFYEDIAKLLTTEMAIHDNESNTAKEVICEWLEVLFQAGLRNTYLRLLNEDSERVRVISPGLEMLRKRSRHNARAERILIPYEDRTKCLIVCMSQNFQKLIESGTKIRDEEPCISPLMWSPDASRPASRMTSPQTTSS